MQIGVVIAPDDYQKAKSLGFDYVEFSGRNIKALDEAAFQALLSMLDDDLPCLGLNAYCPPAVKIAGPGYDVAVTEQYALALAPRAKALGVQVLGIGSPYSRHLPDGYSRGKAIGETISFFETTAAAFKAYGIDVCVEALGPCYCNFINKTDEAIEIVRAVGAENLFAVLDFYNMEHSGEADLDVSSRIASVRHVHMSDDDGNPLRRWFFQKDKLPVQQQRVKALRSLGYEGNITIEIDLPIEPAAALRSLQALREIV